MIKKVKTNLKNDLKEKFKTKILCEKKANCRMIGNRSMLCFKKF